MASKNRRAHFEDILAGLDQKGVYPRVDHDAGLLVVDGFQLINANLAQIRVFRSGKHARGTKGAHDKAGLVRGGILVRQFTSQFHGGGVDLHDPIRQAILGQFQAVGPKGVRFKAIDPHLQKALMNFPDHLGFGNHQVIVQAFFSAEILFCEVVDLKIGTHGPVEDEDLFFEGIQK